MRIEELLTDWKAFEALIASVCATGDVTVEHNVFLTGKSGVERQIDVVIRSTQGLIDHLVLVECKHWKSRVSRLHVDSMVSALSDLNASKGIFFSTEGFQEGALTLARHHGIELFKVRDLNASELFGPNTPLDEYRHYLWKSIRNIDFPGANMGNEHYDTSGIFLVMGYGEEYYMPSLTHGTLEGTIESLSTTAAIELANMSRGILFDGGGGVRRFWKHLKHTLDTPIEILEDNEHIISLPKISYDLGITLRQEHREISNHDKGFMLAIEDCTRGLVRKATKANGQKTVISHMGSVKTSSNPENHILFIMVMPGWVPFDFNSIEKGKFYDTKEEFIKK